MNMQRISLGTLFVLLAVFVMPMAAQASSMMVSVSADPAEDVPVTISVSGTADANTRLFVFASAHFSACPSMVFGNSPVDELSGTTGGNDGDAVVAGGFLRSYEYVPTFVTSHRVCVYLATGELAATEAVDGTAFTPRATHATLTSAESADPAVARPITYTVSGWTEVDRQLFVFASRRFGDCPTSVLSNITSAELSGVASADMDGDAVAAGNFQRSYTYTPEFSGTVQFCAYIAEDEYSTASVMLTRTTTVRDAHASVALTVGGAATLGNSMVVTASGSSELNRRLFVYTSRQVGPCPASAYGNPSTAALSSAEGDGVVAGAFSRAYSFVPSAIGQWRFCAYVAEDALATALAASSTTLDIPDPNAPPPRPPAPTVASLRVEVPPAVTQGQVVPVTVRGAAAHQSLLYTYVGPDATRCGRTAENHARQAGVKAVTSGQRLEPGDVSSAARFGPAAAGEYRVCTYAAFARSVNPYATATATFTILPDPALVPVLVTRNDEQHRDRLVLVWKRGANDEKDTITVYRGDPRKGAEALWAGDVDADDVSVTSPGGNYRAVIRPHLGYGSFWWTITRPGPYGSNTVSEARTQRIVPRPLNRSAARATARLQLGTTSKRPGSGVLGIRSSPRAAVRALVRHGGRVVKRWSFTEGFSAFRSVRLSLACDAPGPYRFDVTMVDPYGTRVTRRGSWNITDRCKRMVTAERRARARRLEAERRRREAERRREEERRRREQQPSPPSTGGGGGGGQPDYSGMTCSEIGHDFYVTPGSDPDHDSDNDGHACEAEA
ncbi:MAG: hypothetical protein WBD40_19025 [Tepidisphaeraceae bacterium]